MDFARKQLEKYGWTDGKGLGKHENGISQALKPKLKRSAAGVGYDAAADFTEHWWSALYDKAAKNVEVEEKNGKTKKIKTKDDGEFEITNSTWRINKKKKKNEEQAVEEEYSDFFVRTDILTGGKSKSKKVKKDSDCEEEPKDVFKLTDEELFAACEGRTAHKGARHGLKALGKLARIEQQEQMLLTQSRFKGYSHAKNIEPSSELQIFEDKNLNSDCDSGIVRNKKKKKKRCNSFNNTNNKDTKIHNDKVDDAVGKEDTINNSVNSNADNKLEKKRRKKKSKTICTEDEAANNDVVDKNENKIKQKKKRKRKTLEEDYDLNDSDTTKSNYCHHKQKKK